MSFEVSNRRKRYRSPANEPNTSDDERSRARGYGYRMVDVEEMDTDPSFDGEEPDFDLAELLKAKQQVLDLLEYKISKERDRGTSLHEAQGEIVARLKQTSQEIATVQQDLEASRIHAPEEGTMSSDDVIQEFKDLHRYIESFIEKFGTNLDPYLGPDRSPLELHDISDRLRDGMEDGDPAMFVDTLSKCAFVPIHLVVLPIIQHLLIELLYHHIFRPFVPGNKDERVKFLGDLYKRVRSREPQERLSRWRALTYTYGSTQCSASVCRTLADRFHKKTIFVLRCINNQESIDVGIFDEYRNMTQELFEAAAQLQDRLRKRCLDAKFILTIPRSNQAFDERYMIDVDGANTRPSLVHLPISLGLVILKSVSRADGTVEEKFRCAIQVRVIADNWGPRGLMR